MAKVKFSAFISEIRNKENGSVFSKNRYGNYIRNKVTPVNPQTPYQQAQRMQFGALSSQYRGLAPEARQSWVNGAPNFPFTDIFGDQKFLAANALYVKLNANLLNINQSAIASAPQPVGIPSFEVESLAATTTGGILQTLSMTVSLPTVPVGFTAVVYATPPTPASIGFVKNRFRFLGVATVAAGEADLSLAFTNRFGEAAIIGQVIHVRVALVSNTSGQMGVPSAASAVIIAD